MLRRSVVYLVTKNSLYSPNCHDECVAARDSGKRIYPLIHGDVDVERRPIFLYTVQYINLNKGFEHGIDVLTHAIKGDKAPSEVASTTIFQLAWLTAL